MTVLAIFRRFLGIKFLMGVHLGKAVVKQVGAFSGQCINKYFPASEQQVYISNSWGVGEETAISLVKEDKIGF